MAWTPWSVDMAQAVVAQADSLWATGQAMNDSKGIKNSSPYTEIVQRQDNTRCPVAEKPQPLKLDNNNL